MLCLTYTYALSLQACGLLAYICIRQLKQSTCTIVVNHGWPHALTSGNYEILQEELYAWNILIVYIYIYIYSYLLAMHIKNIYILINDSYVYRCSKDDVTVYAHELNKSSP